MTESGSPYSSNKVFHHREWIDSLRAGEFPSPIFVDLFPTNRCNHRCDFCAYRNSAYTSAQTFDAKDEIPFEKLREIIADCTEMGIKAVELTGGGEPMVHSQFLDLCRVILDSGLDLGLVTNGSRWNSNATKVLKEAAWVRFSIDAGCEETYARTRHCKFSDYNVVRKAVQDLSSARGQEITPIIGVGFVVTKDNWQEVPMAVSRAQEDGADNIRISAVFQENGASYFDGFIDEAKALCEKATRAFDCSEFRVFNLFDDRISDLQEQSPDYPRCFFQQASTLIGADQNVYRCCTLAYNRLGLLGSVKGQRFKDLWTSKELKNSIKKFNSRSCPLCMFNNKNKAIAYATSRNPLHINFI